MTEKNEKELDVDLKERLNKVEKRLKEIEKKVDKKLRGFLKKLDEEIDKYDANQNPESSYILQKFKKRILEEE